MNATSQQLPPPACNSAAIGTFCDVVFGYLEGLVAVRLLSEKSTPSKTARSEFVPVAALAARLAAVAPRAAADQRAVYVVPGTVTKPGGARAEDIRQTSVILVDLDDGDITAKRAHLIRHLVTPSLEVAPGGITDEGVEKLHLYWRLTEAAEGDHLTPGGRPACRDRGKGGGR